MKTNNAYLFECFASSKAYGSTQSAERILVVKGASSKAEAKDVAQKNVPSLRVFAGRAFANEAKAVEHADWCANLTNEVRHGGAKYVTVSVVDVGMQRGIAQLLGMHAA